jgi:hypothetical protein
MQDTYATRLRSPTGDITEAIYRNAYGGKVDTSQVFARVTLEVAHDHSLEVVHIETEAKITGVTGGESIITKQVQTGFAIVKADTWRVTQTNA